MFVKKPILIGLLVILGVLFSPTPQRPAECGGGSILWGKQVSVENADRMKQLILTKLTDGNAQPASLKNLYWDKLNDGRIIFCKTFSNDGFASWVFDGDNPNAKIIAEMSRVY